MEENEARSSITIFFWRPSSSSLSVRCTEMTSSVYKIWLALGLFIRRLPLSLAKPIILRLCALWDTATCDTLSKSTLQWGGKRGQQTQRICTCHDDLGPFLSVKSFNSRETHRQYKKTKFAMKESVAMNPILCKWTWHQQLIEVSSGNVAAVALLWMCDGFCFWYECCPVYRRTFVAQYKREKYKLWFN